MKYLIPLVFTALMGATATAHAGDATAPVTLFMPADMEDLNEFRWKKRPVVVFADSEDDPAFIEQMALLRTREAELLERDVIVLTDTDPAARSPVRLKMRPRGFMLVLVGKDGAIELRKPFPWSVREISRSIDKMPIRQREIRDGKAISGQ